jgi:hypothetical protein
MKPQDVLPKITDPQRNALLAVLNVETAQAAKGESPQWRGATCREVARLMWPDSPGWDKRSRRRSTPAGGALGATMPMKAGTVLNRLRDAGLVWQDYDSTRYYLTARAFGVIGKDNPWRNR